MIDLPAQIPLAACACRWNQTGKMVYSSRFYWVNVNVLYMTGYFVRALKPKEFELLVYLARNRGMVLTRDLILERVWGWEYDGGSRTVDVHVRWLREKIDWIRPHRRGC